MRITAVICEYNPFHSGHLLQFETIRRQLGEETAIVALMSGSVVQRGEPAVFPKYPRAEAAVRCGADLVLELPAPWSCAGAEGFAFGALSLLKRLGLADTLCFGSECGSLERLSAAADNIGSEAYLAALRKADPAESHQRYADLVYRRLFGEGFPVSPNDILAVEYLAALKRLGGGPSPFTYRREPGYTASGTRAALLAGEPTGDRIPKAAAQVFDGLSPTDGALWSAAALHLIRSTPREALERFAGMNGGVAGCLKNRADEASTLSGLIGLCTGRKYAAARLRRACLAALLGIPAEAWRAQPLFTSLLAAGPVGRELLAGLRKHTGLPVLTRHADSRALSAEALEQYECSRRADRLLALARGEAPCLLLNQTPYIAKTRGEP